MSNSLSFSNPIIYINKIFNYENKSNIKITNYQNICQDLK